MLCINPDCSKTRLACLESRYSKKQTVDITAHRRRRYECPACGWRYSSIETIINVRKRQDENN